MASSSHHERSILNGRKCRLQTLSVDHIDSRVLDDHGLVESVVYDIMDHAVVGREHALSDGRQGRVNDNLQEENRSVREQLVGICGRSGSMSLVKASKYLNSATLQGCCDVCHCLVGGKHVVDKVKLHVQICDSRQIGMIEL